MDGHMRNLNIPSQNLSVSTTDQPDNDGLNYRYVITGFDARKNPASYGDDYGMRLPIIFEKGPGGGNGVTNEALLAIVLDRLGSAKIQGTQRSLSEAMAFHAIEVALEYLSGAEK
jgi:hypothetical protein